MGLLKLLGLEKEVSVSAQTELVGLSDKDKYKADNIKLLSEVAVLQTQLKNEKDQTAIYLKGYESKKKEVLNLEKEAEVLNKQIEELEARVEELESDDNGKKVTFASARKSMSKAKLKALREQLESVPAGATGFGGSVSVYDKKTKRLKVVELKSKAEALELVSRAEKGNVEIII